MSNGNVQYTFNQELDGNNWEVKFDDMVLITRQYRSDAEVITCLLNNAYLYGKLSEIEK